MLFCYLSRWKLLFLLNARTQWMVCADRQKRRFLRHLACTCTVVSSKMQLSVHFASILSSESLQTNQFRENSQEQLFLKFWCRLQWFLLEIPRINIREVRKMIFLGKINYLSDFDIFAYLILKKGNTCLKIHKRNYINVSWNTDL